MTEPRISVIVPVYRAEAYLRRCIESIAGQTYENLEIILVDDGSPDASGAICDEYAARDARIRVLHRPNGGVSRARNAGIDAAQGEYLGFVDSDDWIEPDMYEYLLAGAVSSGMDIVECGTRAESPRTAWAIAFPEARRFSPEEALCELLKNDRLQNHVWSKLYRRAVFDGIRFPDGMVYEDFAVLYRLMDAANGLLCLPGLKYHYMINPGGITRAKSVDFFLHGCEHLRERRAFIEREYPRYTPLLTADEMGVAMEIWSVAWRERARIREEYPGLMAELAAFSREHYKEALHCGRLGVTGRLRVRLTRYDRAWAYLLAGLLRRVYEYKHG